MSWRLIRHDFWRGLCNPLLYNEGFEQERMADKHVQLR